jgi:hypothetical protein
MTVLSDKQSFRQISRPRGLRDHCSCGPVRAHRTGGPPPRHNIPYPSHCPFPKSRAPWPVLHHTLLLHISTTVHLQLLHDVHYLWRFYFV